MSYKYNREIEIKLKKFEVYLRSKRYALDTIRQTRNYAGVYLSWLDSINQEAEEIDYSRFTDFVFQLKKNKSLNLSKRIILAVRHYYESLEIDINPAWGVHIKSKRASVLNDVVEYKSLMKLYEDYQSTTDRQKRNKMILGILIYQGISTGELQKLEVSHVKLSQGKIYIPSHGQGNSRTLSLDAMQLLELQEYINQVRPRMLSSIESERPGRKPKAINPIIKERLFFSESGNHIIKQSLYHMFRSIKKTYPKINSGKIIRSTVIAHWLKTKDIRIVQYMAGHRWVSSTERYDLRNLESLKSSLNKYHPLK